MMDAEARRALLEHAIRLYGDRHKWTWPSRKWPS